MPRPGAGLFDFPGPRGAVIATGGSVSLTLNRETRVPSGNCLTNKLFDASTQPGSAEERVAGEPRCLDRAIGFVYLASLLWQLFFWTLGVYVIAGAAPPPESAAAGAAGTAPAWGPLLRSCAYAETVTAAQRAGMPRAWQQLARATA